MKEETEKEVARVYAKVKALIQRETASEDVRQKVLYECGLDSHLKWEFDELLRQFGKLARANRDERVRFEKEDKRYIRKVFRTEGAYSIQKTWEILRQRNYKISRPTLYKICYTE